MKISHGTVIQHIDETNGYGHATERIFTSLAELGHSVKRNDPSADVEIWFTAPTDIRWSPGPYRIAYFPWESTGFHPGHIEALNTADEVWTPNPLTAQWFKSGGVTRPIYIFEHGVDPVWTPVRRTVGDTFKFLHLGADAARKGGLPTMRAFSAAFPDRTGVSLTMKMVSPGWGITSFGGVKVINEKMSVPDLVKLHHEHHAFVYPSQGEGFGMTPLQAMATAMPTLTVPAWAPYHDLLDPELSLKAELGDSTWNGWVHPGQVFHIDFDDMVDKMRAVVKEYDYYVDKAEKMVEPIKARYDWKKLTHEAFTNLEERLKNI